MSDIVERLRNGYLSAIETCREAADEIERLRTELEAERSADDYDIARPLPPTSRKRYRMVPIEDDAPVAST